MENKPRFEIRWVLTFLLFVFWETPGFSAPIGSVVPEPGNSHIKVSSVKLPLAFEPNQGQVRSMADGLEQPQVRFICRGGGYMFFLTPAESVFTFSSKSEAEPRLSADSKSIPQNHKVRVMRMRLQGANRLCEMEGLERLPGVSHYYRGSDPSRWRTNVPRYAKVLMRDVYPGVDMVYYGNEGRMEYDFRVHPGGDPSVIRLRTDGVDKARVDEEGGLRLTLGEQEVVFKAPVLYQEQAGGKETVQGRYRLLEDGEVVFEVDGYDRTKELVIDPTLLYSTYLGGMSDEIADDVAADAVGNAYVTGYTYSSDFPVTPDAIQSTGGGCVFVSKLDPTGTMLLYSTYLGAGGSRGNGIVLDAAGGIYVAGYSAAGFPTTPSAYQSVPNDWTDGIVFRLSPSGLLVASTYIGGWSGDSCNDIALDPSGDICVVGTTNSTNFPTIPGAVQTSITTKGAFVAKLNPTCSVLLYSTLLGDGLNASGTGIALDSVGNIFVTGRAQTVFPTTIGAFHGISTQYDLFVTKLNPTLSALLYSTCFGATEAWPGRIAVDANDCAYVTGFSESGTFPTTPSAFQTSWGFVGTAFVSKLNASGSALVYSTYLGFYSCGTDIALDALGNAYVTGFANIGFPVTSDAFQSVYGGEEVSPFMTVLNSTGSGLLYSTYLGGSSSGYEEGNGIALDPAGNIYLTGNNAGAGFPTTTDAYQTTFGGGSWDAFVAKFSALPPAPTATTTATFSPTVTSTATATPTPTARSSGTPTATPTLTWTPVLPDGFNLSRNRYNPGRDFPALFARIHLQETGVYSVKVYNSAGELVKVLRDQRLQTSTTEDVVWDGKNDHGEPVASGLYIFRYTHRDQGQYAKVLIIR